MFTITMRHTVVPDKEDTMVQSQHQPPKLLEQVRQAIRTRHYSLRTEETYLSSEVLQS